MGGLSGGPGIGGGASGGVITSVGGNGQPPETLFVCSAVSFLFSVYFAILITSLNFFCSLYSACEKNVYWVVKKLLKIFVKNGIMSVTKSPAVGAGLSGGL